MNIGALFDSILTVLKTFRFVDVIDIVVIAFIVYSLFKLVRDTRAEQLVKGIVILMIAYLGASIFNMLMMKNLLKTLFEFGVVLLENIDVCLTKFINLLIPNAVISNIVAVGNM